MPRPSRLTLERRYALALVPVSLLAVGGLWLLSHLVFEPEYDEFTRERFQLGLEARALPLVVRLGAMANGLEAIETEIRAAGAADGVDGAWDEAAHAYLRSWPEVEEVFRLAERDEGATVVTARRGSAWRDDQGRSNDRHHLQVARSPEEVRTLAGRGVLDPVLRVRSVDGVERTWLVRSSDDGRLVVGALLREGACAVHLGSLLDDPRSQAVVMDAHGDALVVGPESCVFSSSGFGQALRRAGTDTGALRFHCDDGTEWVAAFHVDRDLGLVVAHGAPREAVFAVYRYWLRLAVGLIFVVVMAGAVFVLRMTHRVRVPLVRLASTMQTVARGDLTQRLPVEGQAEFADLARAFNAMISDLHTTHAAMRAQSERLASALQEVEDVEAMKDSFLALVSHEVRTPLTSIMGGVEFLRDEFAEERTEMECEFIEIVYDSARRLSGFMNDAILMASLQANRSQSGFEIFSLTGLIKGKVEALEPFRKKQGVELDNRLEHQREFFVLGDWTLMQVALEKVLHNALRHNRPDGHVVVELVERIVEDPDGDLVRMMTARGAEVPEESMTWRAVRVFNTGPIVAPDKIDQLFERFELTHDIANHQRGSGLSLPIAGYVVNYHQGSFEVRAVDDYGMAFYIVLPGRVGVDTRRPVTDMPTDVDETVAAAHLVRAAGREVEDLERDIEAAERAEDEERETAERAARDLEEFLVGDDADVESAKPEASRQ